MKVLREEEINSYTRATFEGVWRGIMPLLLDHNVKEKLGTNLTEISNRCLLGMDSVDIIDTTAVMLNPVLNWVKDAYNTMYKLDEPEYSRENRKGYITFNRKVNNPSPNMPDYILYYELIFIITAPYFGKTRITDDNAEGYIDEIKFTFPKDQIEYLSKPFLIIQAFTGGFKPQNKYVRRYRGKTGKTGQVAEDLGVFDVTGSKSLPEIDRNMFFELINYQKNAFGGSKWK